MKIGDADGPGVHGATGGDLVGQALPHLQHQRLQLGL